MTYSDWAPIARRRCAGAGHPFLRGSRRTSTAGSRPAGTATGEKSGRPLVAHVTSPGITGRRTPGAEPVARAARPRARPASSSSQTWPLITERLVGLPWSPLPADGRSARRRRPSLEGRSPGVVRLQLVHVRRERAAAARSPPAAAPAARPRQRAGPARRPARRPTAGRPPGRRRRRAPPRPARRAAARPAARAPARHSAAASGAQSHHIDGSTATSTPASTSASSVVANAPAQLAHAARVQRAQRRRERVGHLAVDQHAQRRLHALRRLHEQLRALVRVGGAEERDRQRAVRAGGAARTGAVASELLPDLRVVRHPLAHDVDQLGRVAGAEQRAPHRLRDGQHARHPARDARADLRQPARVVVRVGPAGARRAAAPVAGAGADRRRRPSSGRRAGRSASSCAS